MYNNNNNNNNLTDDVRLFNSTTYNCRSPGALPKTCKKWGGGRRWNCFAKMEEGFFYI